MDYEYNLHGPLPKRLLRECEGHAQGLVYPDIVIRLRGNDDKNILVIQAKPRKRSGVPKCDQIKLEEFTKQDGGYHYEFGLFIGFDELQDPSACLVLARASRDVRVVRHSACRVCRGIRSKLRRLRMPAGGRGSEARWFAAGLEIAGDEARRGV